VSSAKSDVTIEIPLDIETESDPVLLCGDLRTPKEWQAIILFAHGSGSNRKSIRNVDVAQKLCKAGFATLLVDLLTEKEQERDERERSDPEIEEDLRNLRHDIGRHVERLVAVTEWLPMNLRTREFRIGYFGSSTGAGVALTSAKLRPGAVGAIVSRGGRPDLMEPVLIGASSNLAQSRRLPPTLLIVGGKDDAVCRINSNAYNDLPAQEKRLVIIPGATHLFEEPPGALEEVARLAINWFGRHLLP
jgi:putative phosphoribosyl transferase